MSGITRRGFFKNSATAAGGLLLAFHLPGCARRSAPSVPGELNAWLVIEPDDTVIIRVAQSEMGQGVFTALPMIIAEELEVDWQKVRPEYASANRHLREDKVYRGMMTGGSGAVRRSRQFLQEAGATVRMLLVLAAARRWGVEASECIAENGRVAHEGKRVSLRYGELAPAAAVLDPDDVDVRIKSPAQFRLLGKPMPRVDVPSKVDGSAVYSMDVRLPGMLYAAVVHCPVFGGEHQSHDFAAISGRRGVVQTVALKNAVAVVADSWWRAHSAAQALPVVWSRGAGDATSSETWDQEFAAALATPGAEVFKEGDADAEIAAAENRVEADYAVPYLAHACMEPLNCTVNITPERVDVWAGVQAPDRTLEMAAEEAGVSTDICHIHNCMLGGGFGRRAHAAFVLQAVAIAKAVKRPVQTIWSREQDMRQAAYRPMAAFRFRAGMDGGGKLRGWYNHSVTHSIHESNNPGSPASGIDKSSVEGLGNLPYSVAAQRIEHTSRNTHLHVWFWRAVGSSQNAWAVESFIDELALAAQRDPFDFRMELLADKPDYQRVLNVLREKSQWGKAMPAGSAQGMAIHQCFGTIVGQVAEVSVTPQGVLKIERMVAAVDCGNVINPLGVEEQIESAVIYGLSAALHGKINVRNGEVAESNFHDYPVMRMRDSPIIETHLALSGGDKWGGMGEPGLPPAAPAVCNAIFRATGKRIRTLPIAKQDLSWS